MEKPKTHILKLEDIFGPDAYIELSEPSTFISRQGKIYKTEPKENGKTS